MILKNIKMRKTPYMEYASLHNESTFKPQFLAGGQEEEARQAQTPSLIRPKCQIGFPKGRLKTYQDIQKYCTSIKTSVL